MTFTQLIPSARWPRAAFGFPRQMLLRPTPRGLVAWRLTLTTLLTWLSFDRWTVFNTPLVGIDGSWAIGLHLAHGAGLRYGTDFVFTYGPLGWLTSRLPIAADAWPIVLFDVVYLLHAGAILWLTVGKRPHWTRLVLLAGLVISHRLTAGTELPFVCYFFVLAYLGYHHKTGRAWALAGAVGMAVFSFYLKANVGLVGMGSVVMYVLLERGLGRLPTRTALATLIGMAILTGLSTWLLSVQLVPYLRAQGHLIDSYNDVMYQVDTSRLVKISLLLIGASGLLLTWRVWQLLRTRLLVPMLRADGVMLLLVGVQLFVLFKEGFVRADVNHVGLFYKYALLPLSLVFLFSQTRSLRQWAVCTAVALAGLAPWLVPFHRDASLIYRAGPQAVAYVKDVLHPLRPAMNHRPDPLPQPWLKRLAGCRVDVIPWNIDLIYGHRLRYQPRPVMQTYQVTDGYLDSLNATYYGSGRAPDYVLFALDAIDGRNPMADESLTKLALLQRYQVAGQHRNWLLLRRKSVPMGLRVLSRQTQPATINTLIPVDTLGTGLQFWQIDGTYTLLGQGQRVLFQPPRLLLELTDQAGRVQTFRTALPLLKAGLILPAQPANVTDMGQFMQSRGQQGGAKIVAIRILADERLVHTSLRIRSRRLVLTDPTPQLTQIDRRGLPKPINP